MASSSISGATGGGCKYEEIDDGRLRICWCEKSDCFLGEGAYGKVFKAHHTAASSQTGDLKVIEVAVKYPNGACNVEYEIAILQRLNHPNILKYHREFKFGPNRYFLTSIFIRADKRPII